MLGFNNRQIEKLSDLFMDISKGLFLAGFTVTIIKEIDLLLLLEYFITAILCMYFSLKLFEIKGGKR